MRSSLLLVLMVVFAAGPLSPRNQALAGSALFDRDYLRGYLALRYGAAAMDDRVASDVELDPRTTELVAGSLGVTLSKYISLELAADYWESDLIISGKNVGEYAILTILPQIRICYPLWKERLVPYLVGGGGWGFTEFNDPSDLEGLVVEGSESTDARTIYALGGGLEYFVRQNLALGVEIKYVHHSAPIEVNGSDVDLDLDAVLVSGGFRLFFPETPGPSAFADVSWPDRRKLYLALRVGIASFLDSDFTSGFEISDTERQQVISGGLGYNFDEHWATELVFNYHETEIAFQNRKVGELSVWTLFPQVRFGYPLLDNKFVPYLVGGIGVGFTEFNDRTPFGRSADIPRIGSRHWSLAAEAGVGAEYFVAGNVALGLEVDYNYHRSKAEVDGRDKDVNVDTVLIAAGIRAFF
ncbi:MAG: outer membrane beta-barrel protein [Desulfobacterales bacterium]|nr:MAG: outer membrane beta-barrel protein [Desulfobacterales bacterium]